MLDDFYTANPVFPAHAGMSLGLGETQGAKRSFPRSRGDEPSQLVVVGQIPEFSPLTRG